MPTPINDDKEYKTVNLFILSSSRLEINRATTGEILNKVQPIPIGKNLNTIC